MKKVEYNWLGRSLSNYKSMQESVAKSRGCLKQLQNAKTLTEARKVVYGVKSKQAKLK